MNKHIVVLDSVIFKLDKSKHTVEQAEQTQSYLAGRSGWSRWEGNIKAVLTDSLEEGVILIRAQLRDFFRGVWWKPVLTSLKFTVRTTEVVEGHFWLIPTAVICTEFSL